MFCTSNNIFFFLMAFTYDFFTRTVYTEIMSSEQEVANAMPSNFDMDGLSQAFTNPTEIFRMLDKNGDGRVTKEDLKLLLEQFGIKGVAAKVLAKFIFKKLDADGNGSLEPSDLTHANGILSSILKMKKSSGDS